MLAVPLVFCAALRSPNIWPRWRRSKAFRPWPYAIATVVYGAPRFYAAAKEQGLHAIVGSELTLEDESVLPVLVMNRIGYRNLCRMITRAQLRAPKGESRIRWTELAEFHEGLIALTGDGEGPLHSAIYRGDHHRAAHLLRKITDAFGRDHVYIELQRHHLRSEERLVQGLKELAQAQGLPLVATNGVAYAEPWGREVLDVFTCIRHHTHLDAAGSRLSPNSHWHLKSPRQMASLFADLPEAIANTGRLAEKLEFTLKDLGYEFPTFPVPDGETMDSFLYKLTFAGARNRFSEVNEKVRGQLEKELDLIRRLGFAGYFLIVADIVKFAREEDILIQGRGSAANSAVCYALGITAVDPIERELLFERFLSESRKTWPDIDLDLPSGERREKVIQEVFRRYGRHGAAMTANVITYRGRSAMREIGKVLNFGEDVLKRFSDLFASGDFAHTLELEDQVVRAGIPQAHERFRPLIQLYHRMYGLPRHLGQHSGGMVICLDRLDHIVPLENASMPGRTVVQWDKDDCEDLGIIKVDLLGLGMMAVLQEAFALSRERGHPVELYSIPHDDEPTFELLQKADTVGTFQVESRAQMATLPRMKPETFYEVAIQVAIIRPGPISGDLTHPYLRRRQKKEAVTYLLPELEPVLKRTLGVPLFQEQMLQIAMIAAGFDGNQAEKLRRAISFHRSHERMEKVVIELRENMARKGIAPDIRDKIVQTLASFALYGFPESHAISFALLAYASCWLKVHRAPEFYCALLNNQPMGFYSPASLIKDGKRHGVTFRPVCVIRSQERCVIEEDGSVRLGFLYVRGFHRDNAANLVRQRNQSPFTSLRDLLHRVALNKSERRALARLGALNLLSQHRRQALWEVEGLFDEENLYTTPESGAAESPLLPMIPLERLASDYALTGLTTGPHPMTFLRVQLPHVMRACDLRLGHHGQKVTIAGVVICRQRPGTAKGNVFISLEDETGISNAFVPSALFEKCRLTITHEPFLEIDGPLQNVEGVISILAQTIRNLDRPTTLNTQSYNFH